MHALVKLKHLFYCSESVETGGTGLLADCSPLYLKKGLKFTGLQYIMQGFWFSFFLSVEEGSLRCSVKWEFTLRLKHLITDCLYESSGAHTSVPSRKFVQVKFLERPNTFM